MRAALALIQVFAPFVALASNVERAVARDINDGSVAPTPDPLSDGTILYEQWPQLGSVPVNRTEGFTRSENRQFSNLLEVRQSNVRACLVLLPEQRRLSPADFVLALQYM
jgi:hypothetical protein